MRIAYIALHIEDKIFRGGVGTKISTQVRLWREFGNQVEMFYLSPTETQNKEHKTYSFSPSINKPLLRLVSREFNRSQALRRLINDVAQYHPDIIYLRYGLFTLPLQYLYNIAPVVVEINTNDVDEYRLRGQFYYWLNRITRNITLGKAAGFISVSHEIAQSPHNQIYRKPTLVTANGIDLEQYDPLPAPNNSTPVLAMAVSPGLKWHGIDKIRNLALLCPDIHFSIIGYRENDFENRNPSNMRFCGFVERQQVKNILATADVAIGTLSLYKNNMEEASPLKVREALALGLPVIIGYKDTDLSDLNTDMILRLPNTENNVSDNVEKIRQFAYEMIGKRIDRELIYSRIDIHTKEKEKLAFLRSLTNENSN
jgi:hypothetical protein